MGCIFGRMGFVLFWLWGHYTDLISPMKLHINGSKIENIGQILKSKKNLKILNVIPLVPFDHDRIILIA